MIINSVSLWVFGFARNASLDSPESVRDMRRSPLGEARHPFAAPVQSGSGRAVGIASR
jgi:hypothetical protein